MNREPAYMGTLVFDAKSHTYRVDGNLLPHITEVVPNDYSHVHPTVLEKARQRGHAVHKATELYDVGTLDWSTLDEGVMPYLEAWIKFRDEYECEFDAYDVERRLFHPVHKYCGTGDRPRLWIKPPNQARRLATVEIKSIAKMDAKDDELGSVNLQTAAQFAAECYRSRELGIEEPVDRWGIQLRRDGTFRAYQYKHRRALPIFLSYLTVLYHQVHIGQRKFAVQRHG